MRKVSERLNLTQPALSNMLKQLEDAFGVRLVKRSHSGVALNKHGRVAQEVLHVHLASLDQLSHSLRNQEVPPLRIGVNLVVGIDLLPLICVELNLYEPENPMRLIASEGAEPAMIDALLAGKIDCYIGRLDWGTVPVDVRARLRSEPIVKVGGAVICSVGHPLLEQSRVEPHQLIQHPWALPDPASFLNATLETAFRLNGLLPPKPVVTSNYHIAFNQFRHAKLLSVVPEPSIDMPERLGFIQHLKVEGFELGYDNMEFIVLEDQQGLPAIETMRAAAKAAVRQLQGVKGYQQPNSAPNISPAASPTS
ncbi:LysR family transcriptional regulator [Rhodobacteraceae bacterium D3-12]|nr:LysR family transcriptional regulator [Rhodobacteraceae bacterium D3-12]